MTTPAQQPTPEVETPANGVAQAAAPLADPLARDPDPAAGPSEPTAPTEPPSGDVILARVKALGFSTVEDLLAGLEEIDRTPAPQPQENSTVTTPAQPQTTTPPAGAAPAGASPVQPAPSSPATGTVPVTTAPTGTTPAQPGDDVVNSRALPEHVRKRVSAFRDDMKQQTAAARAEAEQHKQQALTYQQQISVMKAEEAMKIDLVRSGISDLDVAWILFVKDLTALRGDKTPEGVAKLQAFSAEAWAGEQRKSRPYLFGQQPVPANGGADAAAAAAAAGNPAPGAPGSGSVTGTVAAAGQFDGRSASPKEFGDRMAKLGINYRSSAPAPGR